MTQSSQDQHVAVLAFPLGCHPWPLLNLACKLACAAPNVRFSFFNTPKSNSKLFSTSQAEPPQNLKAYDVADGVPEGHVFTPGNPVEELELFLNAAPESFRNGMDMAVAETGREISCLLTDAFLVFASEMALDMHAKWVPFWVPAPHSLSAHMYSDLIYETYTNVCGGGEDGINTSDGDNYGTGTLGGIKPIDKTLDVIPGLSIMRFRDLPQQLLLGDFNSSLFSSALYRIGAVLPQASAVIMNSFQELNPATLTDDLKSKFQNLLYVGFLTLTLPPPPPPPSHSDATGCLPWLDDQKPTSVAYISFGTVSAVPPHEFVALAEALEASHVPFLWSLRDNFKEILPTGFLQRTRTQGKIVPWAPQAHVLAHKAVGVYVTHCGYNSVFESVVGEVPMICRPILGDNMFNGRMVEDVWGIGVGVEGGVFTKNGMLKSLEVVLGEEHGKRMREKIRDIKDLVVKAAGPTGIASKDFNTLVEVISK
ncbi:Anthocyanidin 3-O-glucosyltransferase 2 [Morella rubra]|uniref:Glycosyltransferase n=1 Tax=Morella rubra TaxID=262757 RepID=A0A6A1WL44_9ROSI|nr:Anthocyanidin 3-O-glucosyltransferase 2 [Morella rubra]KAB1224448.1 Anthocyanidin 3-O-glucosyltransferase 2 [Morella rubra]